MRRLQRAPARHSSIRNLHTAATLATVKKHTISVNNKRFQAIESLSDAKLTGFKPYTVHTIRLKVEPVKAQPPPRPPSVDLTQSATPSPPVRLFYGKTRVLIFVFIFHV